MAMTRKSKPPVALYSALADASRCRIVELLRAGPKPVHELADAFSISRPAISRHLRVLKTAGLVVEVKKGRENLYSLRLAKLDKAVDWIAVLKGAEDAAEASDQPEPVVTNPAPALEPASAPEAVPEPVAVVEAAPMKAPQPKQPRRPKATVQVEEVEPPLFPDDAVAQVAALAAKEKAVSQMGFDF
jgi:DNA-binding transcriptional ArsR family regulator